MPAARFRDKYTYSCCIGVNVDFFDRDRDSPDADILKAYLGDSIRQGFQIIDVTLLSKNPNLVHEVRVRDVVISYFVVRGCREGREQSYIDPYTLFLLLLVLPNPNAKWNDQVTYDQDHLPVIQIETRFHRTTKAVVPAQIMLTQPRTSTSMPLHEAPRASSSARSV